MRPKKTVKLSQQKNNNDGFSFKHEMHSNQHSKYFVREKNTTTTDSSFSTYIVIQYICTR